MVFVTLGIYTIVSPERPMGGQVTLFTLYTLDNRTRFLRDRLMVKVPARSILPMIAFRDALCM